MQIKDSIFQKTVRGAVELLRHDFEELKKLEALTPILKNDRLFENVLFDILPEFEYKYRIPRVQLVKSAALIREFFVSGPPPSAPEWEERVKQASKRLEAAADLDDELKYFVLDLYCLELAHIRPPKRKRVKKTKPVVVKLAKRLYAWLSKRKKAVAMWIVIIALGTAGIIFIYDNRYYYEAAGKKPREISSLADEYYKKNDVKAVYFYEIAAKKGDTHAMEQLRKIYNNGYLGVKTDKRKAKYYSDLKNRNQIDKERDKEKAKKTSVKVDKEKAKYYYDMIKRQEQSE